MKSQFLIPALGILYSACIVEKPTDCDLCIGSQCGPSSPSSTANRPPSNTTISLDAGVFIRVPDAGRPDLPIPDASSTVFRIDALGVDAVPPTVCSDAGICGIPLPAYCTYNFECGGQGRCANGQCQRSCGAGCGAGTECLSGFCQPSSVGGARCTYASDCVPGSACINGGCFSGARSIEIVQTTSIVASGELVGPTPAPLRNVSPAATVPPVGNA